jgi:mannan endo-1,6-alpha-mannosidase
MCSLSWSQGIFNGNTGVGQELGVLAAVSGLLVGDVASPYTAKSAKTSTNNSGGDGKSANGGNGTSSGGKDGKGSTAAKINGGLLGVMSVSIGIMLLSMLAL